MTTKSDFSTDEWKLLLDTLLLPGLAIMQLGFGVVSSYKEFKAMILTVVSAKERYPDNGLIQAIAAEMEATEPKDSSEGAALGSLDETLEKLRGVVALVEARAPGDAAGYKAFLYEIASATASAAGSGFLGTGPKVSDEEAGVLSQLKGALGLGLSGERGAQERGGLRGDAGPRRQRRPSGR